jgi:replicative DNA helicase
MAPERTMERALAIEGRARIDDVRRGVLDERSRSGVAAAALRLRDAAPLMEQIPAGGIDPLANELRRTLDVRLAAIDPLQALATGHHPQEEELAAAVRRLKGLAIELGVAILVTAHLPEFDRGRSDLRPCLDDFGALGAVKQHADVVLALYREEMYQGSTHGAEGGTELHVLKNRNGPTGYVDLYFYKQWMRFEDMVDGDR